MNIKCLLGLHDHKCLGIDQSCRWTDENRSVTVSFYRCARCGKRTADGAESHVYASGMVRRWRKASVLPNTLNAYVKKPKSPVGLRVVK